MVSILSLMVEKELSQGNGDIMNCSWSKRGFIAVSINPGVPHYP